MAEEANNGADSKILLQTIEVAVGLCMIFCRLPNSAAVMSDGTNIITADRRCACEQDPKRKR